MLINLVIIQIFTQLIPIIFYLVEALELSKPSNNGAQNDADQIFFMGKLYTALGGI